MSRSTASEYLKYSKPLSGLHEALAGLLIFEFVGVNSVGVVLYVGEVQYLLVFLRNIRTVVRLYVELDFV